MIKFYRVSNYCKINLQSTFVFGKQTRNSKSDSKVVDMLWRTVGSGS